MSDGKGICKQFIHSRMNMICLGSGAKQELKKYFDIEGVSSFAGGSEKSLFKYKKNRQINRATRKSAVCSTLQERWGCSDSKENNMVSASACTWVILAQIFGSETQMFIYVDLEKKNTQKSNLFYENKANVCSNRFQTFFLSYISASQIVGRSAEVLLYSLPYN